MRLILPLLAATALAACAPTVPDSASGVGFENYDTYLAQKSARDAELRSGPVVTTPPPVNTRVVTRFPAEGQPAQTEAQATAAAAVAAVRPTSQQPTATTTAAVAPIDPNNVEISDEQDFQAVSSRQSIESNAERIKRQSEQYQVAAPKAVPSRPSGTIPTPIEFALSVKHPVGQRVYRRSPFGAGKTQQACLSYESDELAQDAFLKAGGPKKDKLALDPDGDGYACGWNPAKYRALVRQ